jgi:tetratricopeptide (TPR) repeat protein
MKTEPAFARWLLVAGLLVATACGSSSASRRTGEGSQGKGQVAVKLPPVNPAAMREFEAGMRALRLAGEQPTSDAYARARERLLAAVAIDNKLWEAWHNLGVIHHREGDDDAAAEAFGKALEINPAHLESLLARAEAHRRAGRTEQARGDYESAIARTADDSAVTRNATARLASLLREDKKHEDAIQVIRNALRTAGGNAKVYVELGMVYMAQGRDELAELVLTKAVELDPKEPSIYNAQALLALAHGKSQEAFDRFDYATSLDPNYLDARFNKASVLISVGDFARAKAELTAVVDKNPEDLSARVALGVAHRGVGEHEQARVQWERVVDQAPRRSRIRGDALFNLAVLQMNFLENEKAAAAALDRYLEEAPRKHSKRKAAEQRKKELGL